MLRIGEFAALSGISIYMLRHYDKMGLLVPIHIDTFTGYRYYGEEQIPEANRIQVLKGLGFGLKEINSVLRRGNTTSEMERFLQQKKLEKIQEIKALEDQIQQMEAAICDLKQQESCALSVAVKVIPARKVVALRGIIHEFSQEGLLWEQLMKECAQHKIKLSESGYSYGIIHRIDWKTHEIEAEVQLPVEKLQTEIGSLNFFEVASCTAATLAYQGEYEKIGIVTQYMADWIQKNGYDLCGLSFTTYYISPGNEHNPKNYITEVCFPVKKRD